MQNPNVSYNVPSGRVENTVGLYLLSKATSKVTALRSHWSLLSSEKVHLERCQSDFRRVDERLHQKQAEFKAKRRLMDKDWEDLATKTQELRNLVKSSDDFVRGNEEKRKRSRENREQSVNQQRHYAEQIELLKEKIRGMRETKISMDVEVRSHLIYRDYLNRVVEESDFFRNHEDVLEFYEDQVGSRELLGERQERNLERFSESILVVNRFFYSNRLKTLGLRNQLVDLQGRYKDAKENTRRWELLLLDAQVSIRKQFSEVELVKTAITNVYRQICHRKRVRAKHDSNLEKQIRLIRRTIGELNNIVVYWNERDCKLVSDDQIRNGFRRWIQNKYKTTVRRPKSARFVIKKPSSGKLNKRRQ